jgi:hypothetical protein
MPQENETEVFRYLTDMMAILQIQYLDGFAVVDLCGYYGETSVNECGRKVSHVDQLLIDTIMPGILGQTPKKAIEHVGKVWERFIAAVRSDS